MTPQQLEHVIRASSQIADDSEVVVIGSQALLGSWRSAPKVLLLSIEADVFPRNHPERFDLIDGTIGELSPFHQTFGYYAHGVSPTVAKLPAGWQDRLVPIRNPNTFGATGWCLELHDLAISKLVAGRDKDLEFVEALERHGRVHITVLKHRLEDTELVAELRSVVEGRIESLAP